MRHERIYLDPSDERVWIDTYLANDTKQTRDAMLVVPGGGYHVVCTEREGEPIALAFMAHNMNAFVLNYRVGAPEDHYPKQMIDMARAIAYIRANAERFGIAPHRVFCVGFSAGGHLCGSLATMFDDPEVTSALGVSGDAIRPDAAILAYPVTTFGTTHFASFQNLLGREDGVFTDEEKEKFSLDRHVSEKTCPIFLWHTVEDQLVPPVGSAKLLSALLEHKNPCMAMFYPFGRHGMALANDITQTPDHINDPLCESWVDTSVAWLRGLESRGVV